MPMRNIARMARTSNADHPDVPQGHAARESQPRIHRDGRYYVDVNSSGDHAWMLQRQIHDRTAHTSNGPIDNGLALGSVSQTDSDRCCRNIEGQVDMKSLDHQQHSDLIEASSPGSCSLECLGHL